MDHWDSACDSIDATITGVKGQNLATVNMHVNQEVQGYHRFYYEDITGAISVVYLFVSFFRDIFRKRDRVGIGSDFTR